MANLYTKTGDKGTTGLVGGNRVSKCDPRVRCYGTIDEANSMLGLAFALSTDDYIRDSIESIQKKLFTLGAELASDEKGMAVLGEHILHDSDVSELESIVDQCTESTGKMTCFVTPGVDQLSAVLHVARTIVRRAERELVEAQQLCNYPETVMRFVNRLSDTIYALARLQETKVQAEQEKEEARQVEQITKAVLERLGISKS